MATAPGDGRSAAAPWPDPLRPERSRRLSLGRGASPLTEKRRARRRQELIRRLIRAVWWSTSIFVLGWLVVSGIFGLTRA